jgi:hypothetical protein
VRRTGREKSDGLNKYEQRNRAPFRGGASCAGRNSIRESEGRSRSLLLPGALFVAIGAELLPAFMFIDLRFTTLLQ